jgi:hypothetical protein
MNKIFEFDLSEVVWKECSTGLARQVNPFSRKLAQTSELKLKKRKSKINTVNMVIISFQREIYYFFNT